jgi:hypothetical protein
MTQIDLNSFKKQFEQLRTAFDDLPEAALKEFRANTPVKTGNARRNTNLSQNVITADYPYALRLDQGYSKQSPEGMTAPTEEWLRNEVAQRLKGI